MPDRIFPVEWEIAADELFRRPVRRGVALARPESAHSVHVDVCGLRPGADYFYRFRAAGHISPVGRTRTAPAYGSHPQQLRFAFATCQNYQQGYFPTYRDMATLDLDFVAFLGDYIYENAVDPNALRQHEGIAEPVTLAEYRNRYARYKTDPQLQAAHAAFPWIVTLDDHEIDNDWAAFVPQDPDLQSPEIFKARVLAGLRAWYEHMPLRAAPGADGGVRIFRRFDYGDLARLHVLDTRQYRSDQATTLEGAREPWRTMTGVEQENWLVDGLTGGGQRWNLIANQAPMAQTDQRAGPEKLLWFDPWDGYQVQRERLLTLLGSSQVANTLVCTGDRHFTMACDLRTDFDRPEFAAVAAEITATSLTSNGDVDQTVWHRAWDRQIAEQPHWKYGDGRRGYLVTEVTDARALTTYRVPTTVKDPAAPVEAVAQFVVEKGKRGLEKV